MASNKDFRVEHDTMGEVLVPINALYGAQTQRAVENFPISGSTLEPAHIAALAQIKKSGASGRALAIAGLVVGYATIAFWAFSSLVWVGLALKGFGAGYGMMGWDYMGNGHFGPGMMGNN